jgi:hypothetical protein
LSDTDRQPELPTKAEVNGLAAELRAALVNLAKAREYARNVDCDPWEFAVEIDRLTSLGVTTSDLRWLVRKGYVDHAREVTRPGDAARKFERSRNLAFTKETCFLLADQTPWLDALQLGNPPAQNADQIGNLPHTDAGQVANLPPTAEPAVPAKTALTPRWDAEDRTLYMGDQIVKEFRVRSPNQEAILSAFEEEGWPHYVDDPLSPVADQNPKHRLRDTIKCLNATQKHHLIRFRGDGTGERVRWELSNGATSASRRQSKAPGSAS